MPKMPSRVSVNGTLTISQDHHNALLAHLKDKLKFGDHIRRALVQKFYELDVQLSGHVALGPDDRIRERQNKVGRSPKPTDMNLTLVASQLDEAVTYLLSVLAPDSQMYESTAEKDYQEQARAFTTIMNRYAEDFGHYRQLAKALYSAMKYNFGGLYTMWETIYGHGVDYETTNAQGQVQFIENAVVLEGNAINTIDPYNVIWDTTVSPIDLPQKGEFFALIDIENEFRLQRMVKQGRLFNTDGILGNRGPYEFSLYMNKPGGRTRPISAYDATATNFISILAPGHAAHITPLIESVVIWIWIVPRDFGLSKTDEYELWTFKMHAGRAVTFAQRLNFAHGMLPCGFFMPWEDELGLDAQSMGERLKALQTFGSFMMNVQQRSERKALNSTAVIDRQAVGNLSQGEPIEGVILADTSYLGENKDVRRAVAVFEHTPRTNATEVLTNVLDLMQYILPTNITKVVSDLERATMYQAASTVQGANRRPHKMAKFLNDQGWTPIRHQMYFNMLEKQKTVEILDDQTGEPRAINPAQIAQAHLRHSVSEGIKGIDKLQIIESLRDVINMMLQSQVAQDKIDIIGVIDYWLSLMGDRFDFTSFKIESPIDTLSMEEKDMAFQLFQQAVQETQGGTKQRPQQPMLAPVPATGTGLAV